MTARDLATVRRFIFGRPGWAVEACSTDYGDMQIALRTPSVGPAAPHRWRIVRPHVVGDQIAIVDAASGEALGFFSSMVEALTSVWEAEADSKSR